MKYIDEIQVANKRVFVRADLNVPLTEDKKIADDTRILAAFDTIKYILNNGGAVILSSHMGRPKGKRDSALSLAPVADHLAKLLQKEVLFANDCIGEEAREKSEKLQPGEVLLLENLRFHAEEKANDPKFASELAELADIYVNDAFATAHRKHASTVGITNRMDTCVGGLTLKKELDYFSHAFKEPKRPLVAIFGGVKVSTKMEAIRNVAKYADKILIGGAMANTFFVARALPVGKSLFEPEEVNNAKEIETLVKGLDCELLLPIDVVIAKELAHNAPSEVVDVKSIPSEQLALDIGPKTIELFQSSILDAKTIVWNGPLGAFEHEGFKSGTYCIVEALANSSALTVVGGGDTDRALHETNSFDKIDFVSTGGGAFLMLLEGKTLPAVDALR